MSPERIDEAEMPELAAQVRRCMEREDVTLFRVGSGTILGFAGDVSAEEAVRRPPGVLVRCKEGGGYEMSRNL